MALPDDVKGECAVVGRISLGPMPQEPDIKRFLSRPNYPGRKDDAGKPRWSLVPELSLIHISEPTRPY